MADVNLTVERNETQLIIAGPSAVDGLHRGSWSAARLDHGRVMLASKESGSSLQNADGFAKCSIDMLHDLLVGLNQRRWSGVVSVDTGFGQKRLFFNHGDLTFAGSSLMDDRLGEVIYREGMISMDQLTTSAVQVDRSTKFGQVLLRDQIFSNTELWNALKTQVREIFRSVFLVSSVFIEISKGTPPTEVTFDEGTDALIESAYSAGAQFRTFFSRLNVSALVNVVDGDRVNNIKEGTFLSDMIALAREHQSIDDLLATSKLTDINTLWVLHRMSCLGYLSFSGLAPVRATPMDSSFGILRSKLDAFALLETMTIKAFALNNISFPLAELQKFAWSLNEGNLAAIYVDDAGMLGEDCVSNIISQCVGSAQRVRYFEVRMDSLIRYVLQLCGDMLPTDANKTLRKQYAEISA